MKKKKNKKGNEWEKRKGWGDIMRNKRRNMFFLYLRLTWMESLPASRMTDRGSVWPGPLLYNRVVYGFPSTSDFLLSDPAEINELNLGIKRKARAMQNEEKTLRNLCWIIIINKKIQDIKHYYYEKVIKYIFKNYECK